MGRQRFLCHGLFGVSGYACTERLNDFYYFYHCHYGVPCEIIRNCGAELDERHQGPLGIMAIKKPRNSLDLRLSLKTQLYLFILVCDMIVCGVIVHNIMNSRSNAVLAIRMMSWLLNPWGIHVFKYKVMIFVISSMMAGLAGAFYAQYTGYIDLSQNFCLHKIQ